MSDYCEELEFICQLLVNHFDGLPVDEIEPRDVQYFVWCIKKVFKKDEEAAELIRSRIDPWEKGENSEVINGEQC